MTRAGRRAVRRRTAAGRARGSTRRRSARGDATRPARAAAIVSISIELSGKTWLQRGGERAVGAQHDFVAAVAVEQSAGPRDQRTRGALAIDAQPEAERERIVALEVRCACPSTSMMTVADELLRLADMSGNGASARGLCRRRAALPWRLAPGSRRRGTRRASAALSILASGLLISWPARAAVERQVSDEPGHARQSTRVVTGRALPATPRSRDSSRARRSRSSSARRLGAQRIELRARRVVDSSTTVGLGTPE